MPPSFRVASLPSIRSLGPPGARFAPAGCITAPGTPPPPGGGMWRGAGSPYVGWTVRPAGLPDTDELMAQLRALRDDLHDATQAANTAAAAARDAAALARQNAPALVQAAQQGAQGVQQGGQGIQQLGQEAPAFARGVREVGQGLRETGAAVGSAQSTASKVLRYGSLAVGVAGVVGLVAVVLADRR